MFNRFIHILLTFSLVALVLFASNLNAITTDDESLNAPYQSPQMASLRLVGTAVVQQSNQSLAVLEDQNSYLQVYCREGDRVGQYLIKKIFRDRIIITSGEGEEVVKLKNALSSGVKLLPPKRSTSGSGTISDIGQLPGRHRYIDLSYKDVSSSLSDLEQKLDKVYISPGKVFNRPVGFRITSFGLNSIFADLGLISGDLILGINNQEIKSPEQANLFFEKIRDGGDIDIKLRRRARTYHIHLSIQ